MKKYESLIKVIQEYLDSISSNVVISKERITAKHKKECMYVLAKNITPMVVNPNCFNFYGFTIGVRFPEDKGDDATDLLNGLFKYIHKKSFKEHWVSKIKVVSSPAVMEYGRDNYYYEEMDITGFFGN